MLNIRYICTMTRLLQDVLNLSVSERILMVEAIWDSIAAKENELELTPSHEQLLDERLEQHKHNPDEGSEWTEVKQRIHNKL